MGEIQYLPDWAGLTVVRNAAVTNSKQLAQWTAEPAPAGTTMILERPSTTTPSFQPVATSAVPGAAATPPLRHHANQQSRLSSMVAWLVVASLCAAFGAYVAQLLT